MLMINGRYVVLEQTNILLEGFHVLVISEMKTLFIVKKIVYEQFMQICT